MIPSFLFRLKVHIVLNKIMNNVSNIWYEFYSGIKSSVPTIPLLMIHFDNKLFEIKYLIFTVLSFLFPTQDLLKACHVDLFLSKIVKIENYALKYFENVSKIIFLLSRIYHLF